VPASTIDQVHWLAAGVGDSIDLVLDGSDIYTPLKHGSNTNVVHYAAADELLYGGYLWQENRDQLAFRPAVMARSMGAGEVSPLPLTQRIVVHGWYARDAGQCDF
jgi:hypothetical protein